MQLNIISSICSLYRRVDWPCISIKTVFLLRSTHHGDTFIMHVIHIIYDVYYAHICMYVYVCMCCLSLEVVSSIPAGSTIIYRFLCGFICVSLCQSIKIKPTNMYIASARAQFKINTHRCWNWHLCIPDGLSIVQCSHGHVIGIAFFGAISVAWSVRARQLAAGGVASVWRSWVRSPPGPR